MVQFRSFDVNKVDEDIGHVHRLVAVDLTEPYTIAIYLYFLKNWPELAIFAYDDEDPNNIVGVIVGSLRCHQDRKARGYVAMLAVQEQWRGQGIAKKLISKQVEVFKAKKADEVVLEAKCSNEAAVRLYESQGFLRTRRMHRYYIVMQDAYRLVLPLTERALTPLVFLPPLDMERILELQETI